jgi:outer membrane protein
LTTLPILTQLNQAFLEEIPLSGHGKIESPPEKTVPFAVPTGNILNLSLDQALVMALESNPGIRVAKYNPVLAGFSEQIEQGRFDPELFSEFSYARDRTQEMDADTFTWDRAGEQNHNVLMGLSQKFPSGTDIEIDVTHGIDDIYLGPEEQKVRMGMTVTQALLRGYGSSVNLASIRQAKLNTAVTVHELRGIIEALLADTETAYWDHVLDRQKIDIFENSLDVAKKQLSEVEQSIEIGTLPFIESAVARVEVALREQALIDAKSAFEESRLRLLFYVNQGRDGLYELQVLPTTNALSDPEPEGSTKDHLKLADQYRSDLQEARLRMKQNRLEIVKTRNGILPRLDLFISLGKTGYADSFSNSFRAMNESTYDLSAGIQFSRTLGNRSAKAKDSAARVTLEQAREALENLGQIIQRDVRIVLNDLDRARQQINATRVTRMLQEESVKAEQERFKAGTSTGLLVAQAQRDLLASHILEVAAIIDYRKALVKLYLAEGSLLERRGVSLF